MGKRVSFRKAAVEAARVADEKKSIDIKLYDVQRSSPIADYILVATVESAPQSVAVQDEMDRRLKTFLGAGGRRCDGGTRANWRVIDYGGLVVHLMSESSRSFFDLERLWETARTVRWQKGSSRKGGS
jgi:ribosome-associated protein